MKKLKALSHSQHVVDIHVFRAVLKINCLQLPGSTIAQGMHHLVYMADNRE